MVPVRQEITARKRYSATILVTICRRGAPRVRSKILSLTRWDRLLKTALARTAIPVRMVNNATKRIAAETLLRIDSRVWSTRFKSITETLEKRSTMARCRFAEAG